MADDRGSTSHQRPDLTTPLLYNSRSNQVSFADQGDESRSVTPSNTVVQQETWFRRLKSLFVLALENIRQLANGPWCSIFGGKIEALWSCLMLPCFVINRAVGGRRYHSSRSGVVYLYVLFCCTVVLNLVEQTIKSKMNNATPSQVRQYFMIACMILAVVEMVYIRVHTRGEIQFHNYGCTPLRIYLRAALYIFGFLSMGYSVCMTINGFTDTCGPSKIEATLQMIKALYIVIQTLFLNRFYQARIRSDTSCIQIALAHLLGTNLALWFWTLCTELSPHGTSSVSSSSSNDCPFELDSKKKYFYPLFIEYLLLAASMFYQIWTRSLLPETPQEQVNEETNHRRMTRRRRRRRFRYIPSCGYGIVLGICFAVLFLVVVIASKRYGEKHPGYSQAYSWAIVTLNLSQIVTCYIILVSLQSQQRNQEHESLDHDDALLYLTLVGVLLWEGFHLYSLLLKGKAIAVNIIGDLLSCAQHLIQTITLVDARLNRSANDENSIWICECVLFLLTTNMALWVQDSFFVGTAIAYPGESSADLGNDFKTFGLILRPLAVFFRFHSATCFFHAWAIFSATS